jgi:CRP-like cAMP-binding protein
MLLPCFWASSVLGFVSSNRVLNYLSSAEIGLLKPHFELVDLAHRHRLETPNKPISHVYFIERGIVSIVAVGPRRLPIEVGVVGSEGFTGVSVVLGGDRSPLDTYVQVPGRANRISTAALQAVVGIHPELGASLNRYSQVFLTQIAQTALANDRLQSDELPLTHEFLALMLAVRRPGVTVALSLLQEQGLLKVHRGAITILNRAGLLTIADKFYGVPEAELERLFKRPKK